MLSFLLYLLLTQVPCTPADTTVVCQCKQGAASACEVVRQIDPKLAAELEKAALVLKLEEQLRQQEAAKAAESEARASSGAPEPPDCMGQQHHVISRRIAAELEKHETLRGLYKPRDPRFVARAKDEPSHCGYQEWHRKVDEEVIEWLTANERATARQFEDFLRSIYNRPTMRARFPHGF